MTNPTKPTHGYLTEPKWFRNTMREAISLRAWAELAVIAAFIVVIAIIIP